MELTSYLSASIGIRGKRGENIAALMEARQGVASAMTSLLACGLEDLLFAVLLHDGIGDVKYMQCTELPTTVELRSM